MNDEIHRLIEEYLQLEEPIKRLREEERKKIEGKALLVACEAEQILRDGILEKFLKEHGQTYGEHGEILGLNLRRECYLGYFRTNKNIYGFYSFYEWDHCGIPQQPVVSRISDLRELSYPSYGYRFDPGELTDSVKKGIEGLSTKLKTRQR